MILQRPPTLSWTYVNDSCDETGYESPTRRICGLVESMTTPGCRLDLKDMGESSLASLAALSVFFWPVMPRSVEDPDRSSTWKADFAEMACDRWFRAQPADLDWSSFVLYHLMNINLHANLNLLQNFAHSAPNSTVRSDKGKISKSIHSWVHSRHHSIAKWHAESLISHTKNALAAQGRRNAQTSSRTTKSSTADFMHEPPHLPYGIYYATLILWCASIVKNNNRMEGTVHLALGAQLLSSLRMRIAQLLESILKELK